MAAQKADHGGARCLLYQSFTQSPDSESMAAKQNHSEFRLHLQILTETSEGIKNVHVKRNRVTDEENNLMVTRWEG